MSEPDAIKLAANEGPHVVGIEPGHDDGIGHPTLYVLVDGQGNVAEKLRLPNENDLVVLGKVLEKAALALEVGAVVFDVEGVKLAQQSKVPLHPLVSLGSSRY